MNNITPLSKIKIHWTDLPENYTSENKAKLKSHFSKKYGVDKSNITIVFVSAKKDINGNLIEISGANLDNILDTNYQHQLFKVWIEREGIETDFDEILKFDKEISNDLVGDYDQSTFNNWNLKWVKINNFLAYGKDNNLNLRDLNGLTVISSQPANQGGKTSLVVDSIKFLFIGKTTKTDKNEEIFNRFSDNDVVIVKGLVELGGENIIIERKLTRKSKKVGGWTIESSLKFYKFMPDGTEVNMEEEQAIATTNEIKKMVGNEDTFDLSVLTTGDNLMDLLNNKPTENGKLLNKLVGLGIIEEKEKISREKYNNWKKTKLANRYDSVTLSDDIISLEESNEILITILETNNEQLKLLENEKNTINELKETLLSSKKEINANINQLDRNAIVTDIDNITEKGKTINAKIDDITKVISEFKGYEYDEVLYHETYTKLLDFEKKLSLVEIELEQLNHKHDHLENSEFCPTCSQPLPDVDNSKDLEILVNEINLKIKEKESFISNISEHLTILDKFKNDKIKYDTRNKLEIELDRINIDKQQLKIDYKERKKDLAFFDENEKTIIKNNEITLAVDVQNMKIITNKQSIETLTGKINNINIELVRNNDKIIENRKLIQELTEEEKKDKIYNLYIKMVGRNGITKIVIRTLLPLINSELERIMEDSIDLQLIFDINDKNEVELSIKNGDIIRPAKSGSGYEKTIASLALRCVLSKVSQLPSPNFIVFDEIFGKVSPENYDKVKLFFDKIKHMFDTIFLIVHDERLSDWGDHNIIIKKSDNISKIIG